MLERAITANETKQISSLCPVLTFNSPRMSFIDRSLYTREIIKRALFECLDAADRRDENERDGGRQRHVR